MELGAVNPDCMALLDRANRQARHPAPAQVSLTEQDPLSSFSGHDFQTVASRNKGRESTYTHVLRPRLPGAQKYSHLKGNFEPYGRISRNFRPSRPVLLQVTNRHAAQKPSDFHRPGVLSADGPWLDGRKDFSPVILPKGPELGGFKRM